MATIRVPAPMREDTTGNAQPLDLAGQSDALQIESPLP